MMMSTAVTTQAQHLPPGPGFYADAVQIHFTAWSLDLGKVLHPTIFSPSPSLCLFQARFSTLSPLLSLSSSPQSPASLLLFFLPHTPWGLVH
jgi:hypothetical protein